MVLRQWFLEVPFPPKRSPHSWIVGVERGGGAARHTVDGEGEELSWSQCSSSIDSLNWWKEAFLCSCSPLSSCSMPTIRRLTSRCSPSTTPMSSLSSSKVSRCIQTTCDSTCAVWSCMLADLRNNLFLFLFPPYLYTSAVHSAKQVHSGGCHWSRQAAVLCWHVSLFMSHYLFLALY